MATESLLLKPVHKAAERRHLVDPVAMDDVMFNE